MTLNLRKLPTMEEAAVKSGAGCDHLVYLAVVKISLVTQVSCDVVCHPSGVDRL